MELYHQPEDATKGSEGEHHGSWFVFTYSSAYRHSERQLQAAVETADPGQLQRVLQQWPYQVDALLRLSDYTMRTGQHELSSELIEVSTPASRLPLFVTDSLPTQPTLLYLLLFGALRRKRSSRFNRRCILCVSSPTVAHG